MTADKEAREIVDEAQDHHGMERIKKDLEEEQREPIIYPYCLRQGEEMNLKEILERKPFIIAEVGSNWSTLSECLNSISLAKKCGADAVKFQLFRPYDLYGAGVVAWDSEFKSPYLNHQWLPKLKEKADACGIEFMCSAFSPGLLDAVNPFVNIHKLASSEMCHLRMLEKLKSYGKPTIVSTGAQTFGDIKLVVKFLEGLPVILLHCIAAYPAKRVDLRMIPAMREKFNLPIGYSDHSLDVLTIPTFAAHAFGAVVIEKHVNFVDAKGPDSPHSLSPDEFKAMVSSIRNHICFAGNGGASSEELDMTLRHIRRCVATHDIEVGEALIEGKNFGIYRSLKDDTRGAHPFLAPQLEGRKAKVKISEGDGVWIDDLI